MQTCMDYRLPRSAIVVGRPEFEGPLRRILSLWFCSVGLMDGGADVWSSVRTPLFLAAPLYSNGYADNGANRDRYAILEIMPGSSWPTDRE